MRSFHSGIKLFTGQPDAIPLISVPVWQNGMPQSMQRAPCVRSFSSAKCSWNSFQSLVRSFGERSCGSSRAYSMKPVGFPIPLIFSFLEFSCPHPCPLPKGEGIKIFLPPKISPSPTGRGMGGGAGSRFLRRRFANRLYIGKNIGPKLPPLHLPLRKGESRREGGSFLPSPLSKGRKRGVAFAFCSNHFRRSVILRRSRRISPERSFASLRMTQKRVLLVNAGGSPGLSLSKAEPPLHRFFRRSRKVPVARRARIASGGVLSGVRRASNPQRNAANGPLSAAVNCRLRERRRSCSPRTRPSRPLRRAAPCSRPAPAPRPCGGSPSA